MKKSLRKKITRVCKPYGELLLSPDGQALAEKHGKTIDSILQGMHDRLAELGDDVNAELETLSPHVTHLHQYLGSGSEGALYLIPLLEKAKVAIKYYCRGRKEGHEQFYALAFPPKKTRFLTPVPYFATPFACGMQYVSGIPDLGTFIQEYPEEKERVLSYLEKLVRHDPLNPDIGEYLHLAKDNLPEHEREYVEENRSETGKSVLVDNFDSEAKDDHTRYQFWVFDVNVADVKSKK